MTWSGPRRVGNWNVSPPSAMRAMPKEPVMPSTPVEAQCFQGRHYLAMRAPEITSLRIHFSHIPRQTNIEHSPQAVLPLLSERSGTDDNRRRTNPLESKGHRTKPASIVLPRPTSSATNHRAGHVERTWRETDRKS